MASTDFQQERVKIPSVPACRVEVNYFSLQSGKSTREVFIWSSWLPIEDAAAEASRVLGLGTSDVVWGFRNRQGILPHRKPDEHGRTYFYLLGEYLPVDGGVVELVPFSSSKGA